MSKYGVDTKELEAFLFKENDLLLLGVNGGSAYVPLRVLARIERPYLYDTTVEALLPSGLVASPSTDGVTNTTFQAALQISSGNLPGKPTDVFDISQFPDLLYQMFLGIDPPDVRVFLQQPFHVDQGSLPIISFRPGYAQQGWWDGFLSPIYRPHPKTQTIVLPGLSIALAFQNIRPQAVFPLLLFYMNALRVGVITDPELAYEMVTVPNKARIMTVGGLQPQNYTVKTWYKVPGVRLDMTKDQVAAGVTPA